MCLLCLGCPLQPRWREWLIEKCSGLRLSQALCAVPPNSSTASLVPRVADLKKYEDLKSIRLGSKIVIYIEESIKITHTTFILHGICSVWDAQPFMSHGFCTIWDARPFVFHCNCRIWDVRPVLFCGICKNLNIHLFCSIVFAAFGILAFDLCEERKASLQRERENARGSIFRIK